MNTPPRRLVLALTVAIGLFVGVWAAFLPRSFYDDFPGFGLHFVRPYGPFDEHLVSDVGGAYLAFAAVSAVGLASRGIAAGRAAGVVWTVFGIFHVAFHAPRLMGDLPDRIGTVVSLAVSALLGVALLVLPAPSRPADRVVDGGAA